MKFKAFATIEIPVWLLELGFMDESWPNDALPRMEYCLNPSLKLYVSVNYDDVKEREIDYKWGVYATVDDEDDTTYYGGDDANAARTITELVLKLHGEFDRFKTWTNQRVWCYDLAKEIPGTDFFPHAPVGYVYPGGFYVEQLEGESTKEVYAKAGVNQLTTKLYSVEVCGGGKLGTLAECETYLWQNMACHDTKEMGV